MVTSISVCMATYNGTKTLPKQLESILSQLTAQDELIVVDDCSTDETITLLKKYTTNFDGKVIIKKNDANCGPIKTFEKAMKWATKELIFLSDQDDQWHSDKVAVIKHQYEEKHADIIVHDAVVIGKTGKIIDESWNHYNRNQLNQSVIGNLMKNGYTGAMMAISNRLLKVALPFPDTIEMHDQWLFLVAKKHHYPIVVVNDALMDYVRHGDNVTGMKKRSMKGMLTGRLKMLGAYIKIGGTSK